MKAKMIGLVLIVAFGMGTFFLAQPQAAEPGKDGSAIYIETTRKIEESEAKTRLDEPQFGYVGDLGTFVALGKNATGHEAMAAFVVHHYPHQDRSALGCTKLKYQGPRRLGNVDGWVFNTDWDGKAYPSKVFLSAQKIYFGGGLQDYIAADYRDSTGWAWKLLPLRRMDLTKGETAGAR